MRNHSKVLRTMTAMPIPPEIAGQKYVRMVTFRKNGTAVPTPVWVGEENDKLYVMSGPDSGKVKRIRNNPDVRIAPCTMRGKVTGPEFAATARILPASDFQHARQLINKKYWAARLPLLWSKDNVYIEISHAHRL